MNIILSLYNTAAILIMASNESLLLSFLANEDVTIVITQVNNHWRSSSQPVIQSIELFHNCM